VGTGIRISPQSPSYMSQTRCKTWNTHRIHRRRCCHYPPLARLGVVILRLPGGSGFPKSSRSQNLFNTYTPLGGLFSTPHKPAFVLVYVYLTPAIIPPLSLSVAVTDNLQYIVPSPLNDKQSNLLLYILPANLRCCTFYCRSNYILPLFCTCRISEFSTPCPLHELSILYVLPPPGSCDSACKQIIYRQILWLRVSDLSV